MLRTTTGVASLIDLNNPVVCALGRVFGGILPGRTTRVPGVPFDEGEKKLHGVNRRGVRVRADVVNEKLCDDVLEYLAPTLEAYKGCTVIDVNPGACLWSRKLHDFLQPKRHLLMEPEERYHDLFIQPLLQIPGSTYRFTALSGSVPTKYRTSFEEVLQSDLLPHRPGLDASDAKLRQLDTSFLVTGNLARRQHDLISATGALSPANYTLQQLNWASLANDLFHREGLVRMLWWMPDFYKIHSIPERITYPAAYSVNTRICADVSEVAGTESNSFHRAESKQMAPRHDMFEAESALLVQGRMQKAGMRVPEGRGIRTDAGLDLSSNRNMRSPVTIQYETTEKAYETLAACEVFMDHVLNTSDAPNAGKHSTSFQALLDQLEYPQSVPLALSIGRLFKGGEPRAESSSLPSSSIRAAVFMDLHLRTISLEAHCKMLEEKGEDVDDLKSRVMVFDRSLRKRCAESLRSISAPLDTLVSEQLAFFCSPPALTRDRRRYEPLQASSDDFWPKTGLALLDFVPKPLDLSVPGLADRIEGVRTAQELLKSLFHYRIQPLPWVLDKIAPNAAQDLIPKVPSLTDPRKGGRLNVDALQIRNLTDEMIEGLTRAWLEWPFKPERAQLALDFEDAESDEGEDEESGMEEAEVE